MAYKNNKNKKYDKEERDNVKDRSDNRRSNDSGGNRRSSGKKHYDKRRDTRERETRSDSVIAGGNDISWYVTDPGTMRAVANFPFGNPSGYDVTWMDTSKTDITREGAVTTAYMGDDPHGVPGVMTLQYVPCYGDAETPTSPLSMAAQTLYTNIRSANSGAKNYEPADLMTYLIAMDNIYMAYNLLQRIYGSMFTVNVLNRYMPRVLVQAQGINYESLLGNAAQFKANLDNLAIRISQMAVPSGMTLFERHKYLCSNVFSDSGVNKAQFIVPVPDFLLEYEGYSDRRGGHLVPMNWGRNAGLEGINIDDLFNAVINMVDNVVTDVDCGTISGDILKAYGIDKLYKVAYTPAPYFVQPVEDQLFLLQLHNAMAIADWNIHCYQTEPSDPNEGRVLAMEYYADADTTVATTTYICPETWVLDAPINDVGPEMVVEATRFMHKVNPNAKIELEENVQTSCIKADCKGTELVTKYKVWYMSGNLPVYLTFRSYQHVSTLNTLTGWKSLTMVSMMNYHPPIMYHNNDTMLFRLGEIDNYTPFDLTKLRAINNMALTKMFDVPSVAFGLTFVKSV